MSNNASMTKPATEAERDLRLAEADNQIHSQRMEGVEFTPAMIERQRRFAVGELTMDELLAETLGDARAG